MSIGPFTDQREPDEWYKGCPLYVCHDPGSPDVYIMVMWQQQLRTVLVEDGTMASTENALNAAHRFIDENEAG